MASRMPKTRLSRSTVYRRWITANDKLQAARQADDEKALVRHAHRVAMLSYMLAEFTTDRADKARWNRCAAVTLRLAAICAS